MFVLVTGASGQLGKSLNRFVENNILNHQFVFATREQLDLSNFKNVRRFIEKNQFDIIINCAAYTSVDKAQIEKEQANLVNHLSVKNIAEVARDNYIKLIHISTDYVLMARNLHHMMKLIILLRLMYMVRLSLMGRMQFYRLWN